MSQPTWDELRAKAGVVPWQGKYAAEPGTGPQGSTCHTCKYLTYTDPRGRAKHPKCGKTQYTHGDATTIKTSTAACKHYADRSGGPA